MTADRTSEPSDAEPTGWVRLRNRYLNKGTAFTEAERERYGLHGLLPPVVESLGQQLARTRIEYDTKGTDLGRHIFLRLLQGRNSTLFYSFLQQNLVETLPIVYTPTVGLACQEWSRIYRQEHGLYLSWNDRHRIPQLLANAVGDQPVDVIVVSDGERILGLGDLGVGGMGIPIGKLALYTAVGGVDPRRTLPVLLDTGTDNETLLSDPLYLGWRSRRIRGSAYDELVDAFVGAVAEQLPGAIVQWEDFAQINARRLLDRHRDRIISFNDDIQGTAAITAAAVRAGLAHTGVDAHDLRVVIVGAGSAGTGVADELVRFLTSPGPTTGATSGSGSGMSEDEAVSRCWLVDRFGLLNEDVPNAEELHGFQRRYLRARDEVPGDGSLLEVVRAVRPHALIGVSGQPGLFSAEVIRAMADQVERPIIMPLSNPTPRAEAIPADVLEHSDGRALVGTGSPFDDVNRGSVRHEIAQVNNVYIFPGVGLGAIACRAGAITDAMITAASGAVAELAVRSTGQRLLPPIQLARDAAKVVAVAVARQAERDGVCPPITGDVEELVDSIIWDPKY